MSLLLTTNLAYLEIRVLNFLLLYPIVLKYRMAAKLKGMFEWRLLLYKLKYAFAS